MKTFSVRVVVQSDSDTSDHDGTSFAVYVPDGVRAANIAATLEGFGMNELADLICESAQEA